MNTERNSLVAVIGLLVVAAVALWRGAAIADIVPILGIIGGLVGLPVARAVITWARRARLAYTLEAQGVPRHLALFIADQAVTGDGSGLLMRIVLDLQAEERLQRMQDRHASGNVYRVDRDQVQDWLSLRHPSHASKVDNDAIAEIMAIVSRMMQHVRDDCEEMTIEVPRESSTNTAPGE